VPGRHSGSMRLAHVPATIRRSPRSAAPRIVHRMTEENDEGVPTCSVLRCTADMQGIFVAGSGSPVGIEFGVWTITANVWQPGRIAGSIWNSGLS
jgi:hypothetical protein